MLKKIRLHLKNINSIYFLDKNEKKFIANKYSIDFNKSGDIFLIQCPEDYFFVSLYSLVIKNETKNIKEIYGLLTLPLVLKLSHILLVFLF